MILNPIMDGRAGGGLTVSARFLHARRKGIPDHPQTDIPAPTVADEK